MECWNIGIMGLWVKNGIQTTQYSIIPVFNYSNVNKKGIPSYYDGMPFLNQKQ
jgi:hypothetical protein